MKLQKNSSLAELMNSHKVCQNSVLDGLCIDAFPSCYCNEKTAYMMACRNLRDCGEAIFGSSAADLPDCDSLSAQAAEIGCLDEGAGLDKGAESSKDGVSAAAFCSVLAMLQW